MCGIAGFVGEGDRQILKKMSDTIAHRGPDDEGFYFGPVGENANVGLGFRRLSIIDLSTGSQPIFNEDKTIAVIFNGEIYNFLELRKSLEIRGHKFYTRTDTEAIIHQYEEDGEKCFEKFNGMFAIAIWDSRTKKLILARDRLGKKPLYYFWDGKNFIFGSELKALKEHPKFFGKLDFNSLNKYFLYEFVPTPHSIFQNTFKLLPGSCLTFQNGRINIRRFWDISFDNCQIPDSEEGILSELDKLINDAVKMRLMSDVPLGVFLSGGIDSSAITYYAQKNSNTQINTFSIGFDDESFDESKYARIVSKFLGTEHHEETLSPNQVLELVPKITEFLDEPLADASVIPTYFLSKFTKQQVTVALGGDGGDELFIGYPTFLAHRLAALYEKIPIFLRKNLIEKVVQSLPVGLGYFNFDFKAKKFVKGFEHKPEYRNQIWLGSFNKNERSKLFKGEIWEDLKEKNEFEDIDNEILGLENLPLMSRIIKLYQRRYLMDEVLVKVDRASMAASLEVRAPFLDYRLVEFANSIPFEKKMKHFRTKYLLKKLMESKLPKDIVYRKKRGFAVPWARWFKGDLKKFILDILSRDKIDKGGLFNYDYIENLLKEHLEGRQDHRKLIWTLAVFEMWREKWL